METITITGHSIDAAGRAHYTATGTDARLPAHIIYSPLAPFPVIENLSATTPLTTDDPLHGPAEQAVKAYRDAHGI